ncbi:MAG TPA: kelch repeat-containing protein [Polyangia bacterium]|jgi:hypothetical protein
MRGAACALVLLGLAGCGGWNESNYREFAFCSDARTCPPGQECAPSGVCMRTCTPCASGDCGCAYDAGDGYSNGMTFACVAGFCEQTCQGSADAGPGPGPSCMGNMSCDQAVMLCRPSCGGFGPSGECAPGSSCYQPPQGGPGYCKPDGPDGGVGDGGTRDGGARDGGARDGGADGPPAYQPAARHGLAAARGADGRIYLAGGQTGNLELDLVEAFTPGTCTFEKVHGLPAPRVEPVLAAADTGDLYAIGGSTNGLPVGDVTRYTITTNTWDSLPSTDATGHARGAALSDGYIYLFGGLRDNNQYTDAVRAFLPATGQWESRPNMPDKRIWFAVATVDTRAFIIGGQLGQDLSTVNIFDWGPPAWNPGGQPPGISGGRWSLAAATTKDQAGNAVILATGGAITAGTARADADLWRNGAWTYVVMPKERVLHASVGTPDGNVFLFGGQDANGNDIRQVDVYNVNLGNWVTCFQ